MLSEPLQAIELHGVIDSNRRLQISGSIPIPEQTAVRVIILTPVVDEISEQQWLASIATNSAFDFLKESAEDIYTIDDGTPYLEREELD